jgi:predicted nucleic-acid-binding Zn-ribbon protein
MSAINKQKKLEEFGLTECPKCGETDFSETFHADWADIGWSGDFEYGTALMCGPKWLKGQEHIHRKCRNCGYSQLEKPADG